MAGGRLPDFVVVGAQRAGTTSLFRYLAEHPDVGVPSEKELHYFTYNVARGLDWYGRQFPSDAAVTGEATPYYLFHPHAPRRLGEALPDVKVIALLRDPVERAFSHHAHEVATGFEPLAFGSAIEREDDRLAGEVERMLGDETYYSFAHQHWTYAARGRYADQLEAWFAFVPRDRWLILRSEELFADPATVYAEVLRFLGLPAWAPEGFERFNPSDTAGIDPEIARVLDALFHPHDERLAELLGWEPAWRR